MNMIWHVYGPRDAGPGERQQMLSRAQAIFDQLEVQNADVVRVDVPGRRIGRSGWARSATGSYEEKSIRRFRPSNRVRCSAAARDC